ncbi:hypothetical protein MRB53_032308 [Persea americana]|uniref:Uncharacterized protein n=1 Tax=Persea americana TaxID=3435 RepID=A0ACC2KRR3_PERAE|nr:hypothetical protein MRB53_032308 [Persea americana]
MYIKAQAYSKNFGKRIRKGTEIRPSDSATETMKIPVTSSFAVVCLLLVLGSFSSVSGFHPRPNYLEKMRYFIEGERWAYFFKSMSAMDLPPSLTIFWPTGEDESMIPDQWISEPDVVLYHIVPGKLSYWQLSRLAAAGERIPTLLPYKSIMLTTDKSCNVSVNHIQITHPEKFHNGAAVVHGVSTPLNYSLYGDQTKPSEGASLPQKSTGAISPQPSPPPPSKVNATSGAPTPQPLPPHSQHVAPTPKPSPPSKVNATSAAPTLQPSPPPSQPAAPTPKPSPPSKVDARSAAPMLQPSPPSKLHATSAAPTPQPSPPSKLNARSATPTPQPSPPSKLNARSVAPTPQRSPPSKLNAGSIAPTPQRSPPSKLNARFAAPTPQPSPLSKFHATSAAPTPQPSPTSKVHATAAAPTHHPSSA